MALDLDVVRRLASGPAPHPMLAPDARIVSDKVLLQLADAAERGYAAQAELAALKAAA